MKKIVGLKAKDYFLLAIVVICLAASLFLYLNKNFAISNSETKSETLESKVKTEIEKSEDGRTITRMFFDEDGTPYKTQSGNYGFISEKNEEGKLIKRTFVDADKKPININQGYAIVEYSYYDDNTVDTEMYFDKDGNPARNLNGSYGLKHQDGKTLHVNKNGEVIFNIENIATRVPAIVVIAVALLCLVLIIFRNKKPVVIAFLAGYLLFVFYITLLRSSGKTIVLTPFSSYRGFFTSYGARLEILNNIWLFAPLGAALRFVSHKKWIIFLPILLSVLIELTQLVFDLGFFQVDDIISNSIGAVIGYLVAYLFDRILSVLKAKIS